MTNISMPDKAIETKQIDTEAWARCNFGQNSSTIDEDNLNIIPNEWYLLYHTVAQLQEYKLEKQKFFILFRRVLHKLCVQQGTPYSGFYTSTVLSDTNIPGVTHKFGKQALVQQSGIFQMPTKLFTKVTFVIKLLALVHLVWLQFIGQKECALTAIC